VRPHADVRPGALRRGGLAALLLLLGAVTAVAEDAPLPAGTDVYAGVPPYLPHTLRDPRVVGAWCSACEVQGRSESGTRRGGDLLFAAADVRRRYLHDPAGAAAGYAEAADAYPAADVGRSMLMVRWLALELDRGDASQATRVLADVEGAVGGAPPRDAGAAELRRWCAWEEVRRLDLPPLVARHHALEGRHREAAEVLERLATEEAQALERPTRARLLEQAARDRYRGGMRPEAVRAMEAAIDVRIADGADETKLASLRFWALYAKHGLLTTEGLPLVTGAWPGEAFERDLRVYLRELQGVEGVGTRYLSLASGAYAAGRYETALEIYLLGLRDPSLVELARRDGSIWRGLLMGYAAAMELERFDDAERILEIVERVADEPIDDMDAYTLALVKARRWAREGPLREEARRRLAEAQTRGKDARTKAGRGEGARIETGEEPPAVLPRASEPAGEGGPSWPWLVALVGLGALLVVLVRRSQG